MSSRRVPHDWARATPGGRGVELLALDPGDVHDGRPGAHGGYACRMLYIETDVVRAILADA